MLWDEIHCCCSNNLSVVVIPLKGREEANRIYHINSAFHEF